jgi:hypothetical protein
MGICWCGYGGVTYIDHSNDFDTVANDTAVGPSIDNESSLQGVAQNFSAPSVDLPVPELLQLHAALANILNLIGAA